MNRHGCPEFSRIPLRGLGRHSADPVAGDSAIYLLNPRVVAEDGEWEAWHHAHWIPGADRYPSFAHLMRQQYAVFRATVLKQPVSPMLTGPFNGVYAPDRPRHVARKIGRGAPVKRRLTIEQLIERLENSSADARLQAAKLLGREDRHDAPGKNRGKWADRLGRILYSSLEIEVRRAAAHTLGNIGHRRAVEPLAQAIKDPQLAETAMRALFFLHMEVEDPRMADAAADYLEKAPPHETIGLALGILKKFGDPRLEELALRIVDRGQKKISELAAWHLAQADIGATGALVERLRHENAIICAAAASALRATKDRSMIRPLRPLLKDPDSRVRDEAAESIESLEERF